jgi:hypothetical protein
MGNLEAASTSISACHCLVLISSLILHPFKGHDIRSTVRSELDIVGDQEINAQLNRTYSLEKRVRSLKVRNKVRRFKG